MNSIARADIVAFIVKSAELRDAAEARRKAMYPDHDCAFCEEPGVLFPYLYCDPCARFVDGIQQRAWARAFRAERAGLYQPAEDDRCEVCLRRAPVSPCDSCTDLEMEDDR